MLNEIFLNFPSLSDLQRSQFEQMVSLYPDWNDKINVISRKDIGNLCVNHILHSLAIARFIRFAPGSDILDVGTGGGFPGIPLAVLFPDVRFLLVDRIAKKLCVATDVAEKIGLSNVEFRHGDIAEVKRQFDFAVSRAVMPQPDLLRLVRKNISPLQRNAIPNGLITLKGGDLSAELGNIASISEIIPISDYFPQPFFETKKIVYTTVIKK